MAFLIQMPIGIRQAILSCEISATCLQDKQTCEMISQVVRRVNRKLRNFSKLDLKLQNFRKLDLKLRNMLCFYFSEFFSSRRIFIDFSIYFVIYLQLIIRR